MLQYGVDNFSALSVSVAGIGIYIFQEALLEYLTEEERNMYAKEENLAYLQQICADYLIPTLSKLKYNI